MKNRFYILFPAILLAAPVFASVVVNSPVNHATVNSPISLSAIATTCSNQPVAAMGYSLDNSSDTTIVKEQVVNAKVASPNGTHTLHVKAWGKKGASCVTDVPLTIEAAQSGTTGPPANAIAVSSIQALTNWKYAHDPGTPGTSTGTMTMVSAPSLSGNASEFNVNFSGNGGEIFHVNFGDDTESMNFLYDGWVYIAAGSDLANLEMDMNSVMPNGETVIFGFQCDGWSKTWDYTGNAGTPKNPIDRWYHSTQACNPRTWTTNTWHHVQVEYSRDDNGVVTYKQVELDGVLQTINSTVPSAFALGWGPCLITNFQIDGIGTTGRATVYLDNLTIYRW